MNAKITIELPAYLLSHVRQIAQRNGQTLKETFTEIVVCGLANMPDRQVKSFIPKPSRLRGGFKPTIDDIEAAINYGRD